MSKNFFKLSIARIFAMYMREHIVDLICTLLCFITFILVKF